MGRFFPPPPPLFFSPWVAKGDDSLLRVASMSILSRDLFFSRKPPKNLKEKQLVWHFKEADDQSGFLFPPISPGRVPTWLCLFA